MFTLDPKGILRAAALSALPWLEHGFQTRVSQPFPDGFRHATLRQVHSDRVVVARGEEGVLGEADALVTNTTGALLSIRTADCVPLLLADPIHRAVAAVHAGWRGTVAPILPRAVEALQANYASQPQSLLVAIGPCIRLATFEVGPEVALQFQHIFPERDDLNRKTHLDLAEACTRQLRALGIPQSAIFDCGRCSFAEPELFHSFRRDERFSIPGVCFRFIGRDSVV
ncbi:MAG: peptidoglycan editing factor PgeF [Bryobacterales bacterium]|nr:peptidoglycan editing factor PgeF [Bryobacterales bacterium]